jgi:uncharacterized iron-regulated membrane protein
MTDVPAPVVFYAVLSLVMIILLLAGLAWILEGMKKQAKRLESWQNERARLRWVREIKPEHQEHA